MIVNVTCLSCGYNGGGHSSLISFERETHSSSGERSILGRCMVNVGDGTQRFCNENRVKLSTISCIIITSLAPHNIAGFPGVFLSLSDLGVGSVTVIGPSGLKSSIDLMLPFTNRKYPALNIVEIEHSSTAASLIIETNQMTVKAFPVYAAEGSSKVMAIGASVYYSGAPLTTNAEVKSHNMVSVFPMPYYFEAHPTLEEQVNSVVDYGQAAFKRKAENVFLFVPLAVSSFDSESEADRNLAESDTEHFQRLYDVCEQFGASGIMSTGNLSASQFEFTHSQSMLSVLNSLCKPVFPEIAQALRPEHGPCHFSTTSATLRLAAPMLTVPCGPVDASAEHDAAYLAKSANRVKQRNASMSEIYRCSVLPRLCQILTAKQPTPHASAMRPPPPPPPLPSYSHHTRTHSEVLAPPHPSLPAPPRRVTSAPMTVPSSAGVSLNILTDASSLSEPYNSGADSFSSLASDEPSETGTPSPQSNFSAASNLRANLLAKRKLANRTPVTGFEQAAHMGIGFEKDFTAGSSKSDAALPGSEGSTMKTENGLTLTPVVGEEVVSITPLKSLRLNDSSKHFTFSSGDSPQKTATPHLRESSVSAPTSNWSAVSESVDLARQEAFAHAVFGVPPPNPFGDICTVTFLGTGSATPSKYRNGSSIMLAFNSPEQHGFTGPFSDQGPVVPAKKQVLLLDCGEGTATQIFQSVASDIARFDETLLGIKIIWISHHHADHITGVPMLLEQIKRAQMRRAAASKAAGDEQHSHAHAHRNSMRRVPTVSKYDMRSMFSTGGYEAGKVMIIGSEAVLKYFEFSACVAGLDDLVTFTPIVNTLYAGATSEIAAATGGVLTRLRSIPVQHCHSSYGLVLDFKSGHKIVYSGDCRPSQSLVKAGIDCDLLIHEATFDDSKQEDAVKKRHSTSSEARRMAVQMHAKHTVLTHFSQRYPLEVSSALHALADQPGDDPSAPQSHHHGAHGASAARGAAVSYDFLKFSFPSQAESLPLVTAALGSVLTALEEERRRIKEAADSNLEGTVV